MGTKNYQTLERQAKENLVSESETDRKLMKELQAADEATQIKMLVNLASIGRYDFIGCGLKPGTMEKVFAECRKQGIDTEQIK